MRDKTGQSRGMVGRIECVYCQPDTRPFVLRMGEPWAGAVCRLQGDVFSIDRLAAGKWIDSGYVGIGSVGD